MNRTINWLLKKAYQWFDSFEASATASRLDREWSGYLK